SPVPVWMTTLVPTLLLNSAAWRLISASAAGTKLTHCRSWTWAPARGVGIAPAAAVGVAAGELVPPPQASRIGPAARPAAVMPAAERNFLRVQSEALSSGPQSCRSESAIMALLDQAPMARPPCRRACSTSSLLRPTAGLAAIVPPLGEITVRSAGPRDERQQKVRGVRGPGMERD